METVWRNQSSNVHFAKKSIKFQHHADGVQEAVW
jgi:hypothetical protein